MKRDASRKRSSRFAIWLLILIVVYVLGICLLAVISDPKLAGKNCLPSNLKNAAHGDYLVFKSLPRAYTAFCFVEPPTKLAGNERSESRAKNGAIGPASIPENGGWQLSMAREKNGWPFFLPYFALTTTSGWHFRLGCRWDETDHYYVFPSIALKRLKR